MATLKLFETIASKISSLTKVDGNIIVARDSKALYVDLNGSRIEITDYIDVDTEQNLKATLTPLSNKYYFALDTKKIFRYLNGKWVSMTPTVPSIANNLTTNTTGKTLDAYQGKLLNDKFANYVENGDISALRKTLTVGKDFNVITDEGVYNIDSSFINNPLTTSYGIYATSGLLVVNKLDDLVIIQRYYGFNADKANIPFDVIRRGTIQDSTVVWKDWEISVYETHLSSYIDNQFEDSDRLVTHSEQGLMSSEDKTKLDDLPDAEYLTEIFSQISESISGENILPYPYYDGSYKESNNVIFTVINDGSIVINSNNSTDMTPYMICRENKPYNLQPGTYTLHGCPDGGSDSTWRLRVYATTENKDFSVGTIATDYGNGATFTLTEPLNNVRIYCQIASGITINDLVFYPMLEIGDMSHKYQPPMYSKKYLYNTLKDHVDDTSIHITDAERTTWNGKQNALTTQTPYSAKGSSTEVPKITTNSLGQVTKIETVTIDQPTVPAIVNNLTTTTTGSTLDAYQGKVLNEKFNSYVPNTLKVAGKTLTGDITLSVSDITGAAAKSDVPKVLSNLTTTTVGSALDATQGKVLDDKLNSIGGRNLFRGSNNPAISTREQPWIYGGVRFGSGGNGTYEIIDVDDSPVEGITKAFVINNNTSGNKDFSNSLVPLKNNRNYTFSIWVKGTGHIIARNYRSNAGNSVYYINDDFDCSEWTKISGTTQLTFGDGENVSINFGVTGACTKMMFIAPKFEEGEIATAWTPAPEDSIVGDNLNNTAVVSNILSPNKVTFFNTPITSLTVTLPPSYHPSDEFNFAFTTASTGSPVVTLPSNVYWFGTPPNLKVNKYYECSIMNDKAIISGGMGGA